MTRVESVEPDGGNGTEPLGLQAGAVGADPSGRPLLAASVPAPKRAKCTSTKTVHS